MMKKVLIGLGAVVVLLVVAAVVVPMMIPVETYKQEVAAQFEAATGRKLKIAGDVSLSVLPSLELEAERVSVSNVRGGKSPNMLELKKLQVQLALFPLIASEIVIDRFVLVDPVINLEKDRRGRPNWELGTKKKAEPARPAKKRADKPAPSEPGAGIGALKLGDVRLVNGRLSFLDRKTGEKQVVKDINMKIALPDLDSKLEAEGALVWNGEKLELEMELDTPKKFMDGKKAKAEVELKSRPVRLSYKGSLSGGKAIGAAGKVDLNVPSVRKLAAWTGQPLKAGGNGFGLLSIKGDLKMAGPRITFENAELRFDEMKGKGRVRLTTGGRRPAIDARLDLDKLDLNPYMPPEGQGKPGAKAGGRKKAAAKAEGWSDEPLDLSGLKAADANLALSVGGIAAQKLKIGKTALTVVLKAGRLTASLKEMALYGGEGTALIKVNGAGKIPTVENTLSLSGVEAKPFLKDAMDFERIEGTTSANMKFTTRGRSQRQMVSALNGAGKFTFLDGAILGVDLEAMVKNIGTAFIEAQSGKAQKTPFGQLTGTFTARKGILSNKDMLMKSPVMRLTGAGTVDLPRKRMNYRVTPEVAASVKGQATGVAIPVVIKGPWDNLSYQPDVVGAVEKQLTDPGSLLNLLQKKGGSDGGGSIKPEDALKSLFGR